MSMKISPNERGPSKTPLVESWSTRKLFWKLLNLKRKNGDIKAQSFNKMTNKMAKSLIKMKIPQLNFIEEK